MTYLTADVPRDTQQTVLPRLQQEDERIRTAFGLIQEGRNSCGRIRQTLQSINDVVDAGGTHEMLADNRTFRLDQLEQELNRKHELTTKHQEWVNEIRSRTGDVNTLAWQVFTNVLVSILRSTGH